MGGSNSDSNSNASTIAETVYDAEEKYDATQDVALLRIADLFETLKRSALDGDDVSYTNSLIKTLTLSLPHCTPATVVFLYEPKISHSNRNGVVHGGAIATLFDFCTSFALFRVSRPGAWELGGVSRGLNVTYLKAVEIPEEDEEKERLLVECELVGSAGKRMAVMRGTLKKQNGEILAICEHGKVNNDPPVDAPISKL